MSLIVVSCHKKPAPATPPAPVIFPKAKPDPLPTLPPAPDLEGPKTAPAKPPVAVDVKPPPPPKPATKKTTRPSKKAPDIKAEVRPPDGRLEPRPDTPGVKPEPEPPKPPVPGLGEILTPDQVREYNRRLDAALDRSKNALIIIQSKTLNSSQKRQAERIGGFIAQAEQLRQQDLATSTSLAERADVLSKDLLGRLR